MKTGKKVVKAIWVSQETHRRIKVRAAELGMTVEQLLARYPI